MNMNTRTRIDTLFEDLLDCKGLQQLYAQDYDQESGFVKCQRVESRPDGTDVYLVLVNDPYNEDGEWLITKVFVSPAKGKQMTVHGGIKKMTLDFAGVPDFETDDAKKAEDTFTWMVKDAHMVGGSKVKIKKVDAEPRVYNDRPYRAPAGHVAWNYRGRGGDNPHWDGNRYAL